MKLLPQPLLAFTLFLVSLTTPTRANPDFDEIGKAMTYMLTDAHFEVHKFDDDLNDRILETYLETLDPEKLYLTQGDVDEFRRKYVNDPANAFDILLLRSRGMEPAKEIYTRFAIRVSEQTEYIETLADNAAFDFTTDVLVPLSRDNAPWPADRFAAQQIWRLRIADELLKEELLRGELAPEAEQPATPLPEVETPPAPVEGQPQELQGESEVKEAPPGPEPKAAEPAEKREVSEEAATPIIAVEEKPLLEEPVLEKKAPVAAPSVVPKQAAPVIPREAPRKVIKERYLRFKEIRQAASDEEIADYFLSAVAQAHDPHSDYLSVKENERFDGELRNQLTGIGAWLESESDGSTRVTGIIVGGPADRQGDLKPNDRLVAIDPLNSGQIVDITYLPIVRVVQTILGRKDTEVGLIVENRTLKDNQRRKVVIRRGTVQLKNEAASGEIVRIAQRVGPPRSLGWITIPSFYFDSDDSDPSVYKDVQKLVARMKKEKVDGIALDLRDNGGGDLEEAERLAGLFLPRGPVVQTKDQRGNVTVRSSTPLKPEYEGPLLVVTDRFSASSSEIFAGVLQDYNRAIVFGESSTYGKGTVQRKMGVADFLRFMQDPRRAGDLKTTVMKFYRVNGSSTQLKGVVPDIIVPSLNDSEEIGEAFLNHALPHDTINPARNFRPQDRNQLFLPIVADQSRQRIEGSPDFQYIREDLIRAEGKRLRNVVTLNRKERLLKSRAEQKRVAERNEERRERFTEVEKLDQQHFHFLRLTLEDVDRPSLLTVDRERDSQSFVLQAPRKAADPASFPDWPSGLDPVKREGIAILEDLIDARKAEVELAELKKAVEARSEENEREAVETP